jgi:cation/acetate symporter
MRALLAAIFMAFPIAAFGQGAAATGGRGADWIAIMMFVAIVIITLMNLGSYTFADAAAFRLDRTPIRLVAAIGSLVVVLFYLIAQMIGAGKVIELLFGANYLVAVASVGFLMILYVTVGGMQATTWVQITKAALLLCGGTLLGFAVLWHFDFSVATLFATASGIHPKGAAILAPGGLFAEPVSAISLGLALVFGTAGLPHILMRFFTVKDSAGARKSVFYATSCVAYFSLVIPILGFGAVPILMSDPSYFHVNAAGQFNKITDLIGGTNMAAIHLSGAVGGPVLLGFMSAVAFATILAVVAGLTLAGCSAISHDIYGQVIAKGKGSDAREVWVSKVAAICIGLVAVLLAYAFEKQNVAFMAGLALSVAASCNFPVLATAIFWRGTTTRGAVTGALAGLISSVVLVVLSKTVWVAVFGFKSALFPYENPALFSMPLAFLFIWLFSVTDKSARAVRERAAFDAQFVQSEIGIASAVDIGILAEAGQ